MKRRLLAAAGLLALAAAAPAHAVPGWATTSDHLYTHVPDCRLVAGGASRRLTGAPPAPP
jgi:hypothetical protein